MTMRPEGIVLNKHTAQSIATWLRLHNDSNPDVKSWIEQLDPLPSLVEEIEMTMAGEGGDLDKAKVIMSLIADALSRRPVHVEKEKRTSYTDRNYSHTWIDDSQNAAKRKQRDTDVAWLRRLAGGS
jgi:hypothetical protein